MEFKGTKGEWEIMIDDDEIKVIQSSSLENGSGWRSYVAICNEVQCSEDANLIAAAPDLLEVLQAAMEYIDAIPKDIVLPAMPGFDRDWVDDVISKALGGGVMGKFSTEVYEYFVMDGRARHEIDSATVFECLGRRLPQAWKIRRDWGGTDAVIARALVKAEDANGNTTSCGDFEYVGEIE